MEMKYTRLYTGDDGKSHFEEIKVPLETTGIGIQQQSRAVRAKGIFFSVTDGPFFSDFHKAPRRQYVVILEGNVEIGASNGTKKRFGPGDILRIEDTTGKGHTTQSVNDGLRKELFIVF